MNEQMNKYINVERKKQTNKGNNEISQTDELSLLEHK